MAEGQTICIHATTIAFRGKAVLLRGSPGAGKSSLALQALESHGTGLGGDILSAELVSDDQTILIVENGIVWAQPPEALRGLLEVRGLGIIKVPHLGRAPLSMAVDLRPFHQIERMPDPDEARATLLGQAFPLFALDPSQPAALSRLRTAWRQMMQET